MTTKLIQGVVLGALVGLSASAAFAADVRTYQVTGPVVSVTDTSITVQKGKDNWEIGKSADTKTTGDIKPGEKVTIMYRMTAASIEAKGGGAKAGGGKKK